MRGRLHTVRIVVTALLAAALVGAACTEATKDRVLRFFFDGVPKPGEKPPEGYAVEARGPGRLGPIPPAERPAVKAATYTHPPFRDGRCGVCHNPTTGQLFRTPQEGLCRSCHSDVPGQEPYVHGPVAVSACLFCHHFHASAYPKVLLDEATALCLRCHRRGDLTGEPHHAAADAEPCIACHDPHAGNDRFFLRRSKR